MGLIGSGFIAKQKHLPAWKKVGKKAQVVALCDPNVAQAEELARVHGIPKVYSDFQQMLEVEHLDAVDICSPPRTHADLAIRSLQAGAHALIEKPMAINTEECDRILAAAREAGARFASRTQTCFILRSSKPVNWSKRDDRRIPRHADLPFDPYGLHHVQARALGAQTAWRRHWRDRART